jgi:Domain of unknown function (DUF4376)
MSLWYLLYDDDAKIIGQVCVEDEAELEREPEHARAVLVPDRGDLTSQIYDEQSEQWLPNLDVHRLRAWQRIKAARDAAETGGCETPLGRVDTDETSRGRITGAVSLAMIAGPSFTIDWTMADNSVVTHDQAAMIALGVAVGTHVGTCHAIARGLKAPIEAATSVEDLDAIEWPE